MIISVASGKGGTGKTTVAINLALSLGDVQLIDCDVEEPNAHLFLDFKVEEREEVKVEYPVVDREKCNLCKQCSDFCMFNAIAVTDKDIMIFPELCHSCGGCKLVCPRDAIDYDYRVVGEIESGRSGNIEFIHGIMKVGEARAIPVIRELKKKIKKDKIAVIDSPPGAGCSMIESVESSDFCILVTEPTPFGLYDLKIAVDVLRKLRMPFGVVINKDGIGDKRIDVYCSRENIPVMMRIPFDREIASLYSKGIPFVAEKEEWRERFRELFDKIRERLR